MYDFLPTKEEQNLIFNISTLKCFNELNFDRILYPSNIQGNETYIKTEQNKDSPIINGYKVTKKHKNSNVETTYFVKSEWIEDLPIEILETQKISYNKDVYLVVTKREICRIKPEQKMSFKELTDYIGIPYHSNLSDYLRYKLKCIYARTKEQFFFRAISDSAFGKTKFLETLNLMSNKVCIISDATPAKLFFAICWQKLICINELPDNSDKKQYVKFCNELINIGDKSKSIENPARKTEGTFDVADISKLSCCFTHNFANYYQSVGLKGFDEIFPYNVVNRYYYNSYYGVLGFHQPYGYDAKKVAEKYQEFIKDVIKTLLWYEENWHNIRNPYPECLLDGFKFRDNEPRFKEHFKDFAKCISEYSDGDMNLYVKLLIEEYKSFDKYDKMIHSQKNEEIIETNTIQQKGEN